MKEPKKFSSNDELLHAFRQGDTDAFFVIYMRYHGKMLDYVLPFVKSEEAARKIINDTFSKVWKQREEMDLPYMDKLILRTCRDLVYDYFQHVFSESSSAS